jgi:pyridoxamine 5'-phosphate oxidase
MKEYQKHTLSLDDLNPDPFQQFAGWFEEAKKIEIDPGAMALATASLSGLPSCRMVLLKGWDERGFLFFTNSTSRKGREIAENPLASVTFYWKELERQVIGEGKVSKITSEESDLYFATRLRQSQLGAWASRQDAVLSSREELTQRLLGEEEKYKGMEIPRPPHWEGYRIAPYRLEFWQGRENRLHDRFVYRFNGQWQINRLSP